MLAGEPEIEGIKGLRKTADWFRRVLENGIQIPGAKACGSLSCPNALCIATKAHSARPSSMTQDILISDVLIICILIFSSESVLNSFSAIPQCDLIPTPTIESFAILSSAIIFLALISSLIFCVVARASGRSSFRHSPSDYASQFQYQNPS